MKTNNKLDIEKKISAESDIIIVITIMWQAREHQQS